MIATVRRVIIQTLLLLFIDILSLPGALIMLVLTIFGFKAVEFFRFLIISVFMLCSEMNMIWRLLVRIFKSQDFGILYEYYVRRNQSQSSKRNDLDGGQTVDRLTFYRKELPTKKMLNHQNVQI